MFKKLLLISTLLFCNLVFSSEFIWHEATIGNHKQSKAAILVEVKIGDITCLMQLDTGIGTSRLYPNLTPNSIKIQKYQKSIRINNFSIDGIDLLGENFDLFYGFSSVNNQQRCDDKHKLIIGSIGNHFFLKGNLRLDLSNKVITYSEGDYLPQSTNYIKANMTLYTESGHTVPIIYVDTQIEKSIPLLFDTGSAPAGIIWEKIHRWREVSQTVESKKIQSFKVFRWGKQIRCQTLEKAEPLIISNQILGNQIEHNYCSDAGDIIAAKKSDGILGLALFANKIITISYRGNSIYIENPETHHNVNVELK